jgi:hypothetical protein
METSTAKIGDRHREDLEAHPRDLLAEAAPAVSMGMQVSLTTRQPRLRSQWCQRAYLMQSWVSVFIDLPA